MNPSCMTTMTRRACLSRLALAGGALALPCRAAPAEAEAAAKPSEHELAAMARMVERFMAEHRVPGLSLVIARAGHLVYQQGFGVADRDAGEKVTPGHLFRIASVSKPVTAVAIFSLIGQGRLKPDDRVFGAGGLLEAEFGKKHAGLVDRITIHHLLTHTCGGWQNDGKDPMFRKPEFTHRELIEWTLRDHPLEHEPGRHYAYSNFGYCVLGRVVEKITGRSYVDHVRQEILAKCGVTTMCLAGNTLRERVKNEVVYYGQGGEDPYRMNVARMDSHGGWLGTSGDLVRFAQHVDGFASPPDILGEQAIKAMTTPTAADPGYACGWAINRVPNWWHGGSLPGTSTLLVRTASGLCWAAFMNTRTDGIGQALDRLMWQLVRSVPAWRA